MAASKLSPAPSSVTNCSTSRIKLKSESLLRYTSCVSGTCRKSLKLGRYDDASQLSAKNTRTHTLARAHLASVRLRGYTAVIAPPNSCVETVLTMNAFEMRL